MNFETPVWEPLINLVGEELVDNFMWMYSSEHGVATVHAYKNRDTRRYVFIDMNDQCYRYTGGEPAYIPQTSTAALEHAYS